MVLIVLYALYLLFYLRRREEAPGTSDEEQPSLGKVASYVVLLGATAAVAYVSEAFVGAIEPLSRRLVSPSCSSA